MNNTDSSTTIDTDTPVDTTEMDTDTPVNITTTISVIASYSDARAMKDRIFSFQRTETNGVFIVGLTILPETHILEALKILAFGYESISLHLIYLVSERFARGVYYLSSLIVFLLIGRLNITTITKLQTVPIHRAIYCYICNGTPEFHLGSGVFIISSTASV